MNKSLTRVLPAIIASTAILGSLAFAGTAFAATETTGPSGFAHGARSNINGGNHLQRSATTTPRTPATTGNGQPVIGGNVTAINGNTLTVTNKSNITYTVDVASATIIRRGVTGATLSTIMVGDSVVVQGAVQGTSITASSVIDQGTPRHTPGAATSDPTAMHVGGFMGSIGGFFSKFFGFF